MALTCAQAGEVTAVFTQPAEDGGLSVAHTGEAAFFIQVGRAFLMLHRLVK